MPLPGVRLLDLSRVVPGSHATLVLGGDVERAGVVAAAFSW